MVYHPATAVAIVVAIVVASGGRGRIIVIGGGGGIGGCLDREEGETEAMPSLGRDRHDGEFDDRDDDRVPPRHRDDDGPRPPRPTVDAAVVLSY